MRSLKEVTAWFGDWCGVVHRSGRENSTEGEFVDESTQNALRTSERLEIRPGGREEESGSGLRDASQCVDD